MIGRRRHTARWLAPVGAAVYFLAAFALLGLLGWVLDEEEPRSLLPGR